MTASNFTRNDGL